MKEPTWILDDVVQAVHSMLLAEHGGGIGIRDEALLDSAPARAKQKHATNQKLQFLNLPLLIVLGLQRTTLLLMEINAQPLLLAPYFWNSMETY